MATTTTKKSSPRTKGEQTTVIPDDVKKPQDHKAAKAEATDTAVEFDYEGHTYTVDPNVARDVELMESIGDMQDGQYYLLPKVVRAMLGEEQYRAWKERARDPQTGRVDAEKLGELFGAIDSRLGN